MESYGEYLKHHGIIGMKWGVRNGPPYPLTSSKKSDKERSKMMDYGLNFHAARALNRIVDLLKMDESVPDLTPDQINAIYKELDKLMPIVTSSLEQQKLRKQLISLNRE